MNNEDIVKLLDKEFSLVRAVGKPLCKIKDEDFRLKIKQTLEYLDCDCYDEKCCAGFRVCKSPFKNI